MNLEQIQTFQNQTSCKTYFDSFVTTSKLDDIAQTLNIKLLKIQNLISNLQSKTPYQRNQKDIKAISDLLKQVPYFSSLSRNQKMLYDISSWIQYRKIQSGCFVYKIGDSSQCFYILLKGEIQLSYPEKIIENSAQTEQLIQQTYIPLLKKMLTEPPILSPFINSSIKRIPDSQLKRVTKKISLIDESFVQKPYTTPQKPKIQLQQKIIRLVCQGQSFGDLGETGRRGTNAKAKQISHLIVIKRQFYSEISKAQLKSDSKLKFQFLISLQFFKLVYRYSVQSLLYFLQQHKVGYNSTIYHQQDLIKYIYVIYRGEFKLYKKVTCKKKQDLSFHSKSESLDIQQTRITQRNICFKTIQIGEILGHLQVFHQKKYHFESCVCKSQQGIILRLDRSKFMRKILTSDHNIEELMAFVKEKYQIKIKQLSQFVNKQQNDALYVRYLHTPSARSRKIKTQSAAIIQKEEKKQFLKKLSACNNNFFNKINENVIHHAKSKRISVNRISKVKGSQQKNVPSSVKDIVSLVKHQNNYQSLRKPQKDITLFQFNISKVPLHVKKKYDFLFKKNIK